MSPDRSETFFIGLVVGATVAVVLVMFLSGPRLSWDQLNVAQNSYKELCRRMGGEPLELANIGGGWVCLKADTILDWSTASPRTTVR